jgi:hypothetical protein
MTATTVNACQLPSQPCSIHALTKKGREDVHIFAFLWFLCYKQCQYCADNDYSDYYADDCW